jgi:hypothetical protein
LFCALLKLFETPRGFGAMVVVKVEYDRFTLGLEAAVKRDCMDLFGLSRVVTVLELLLWGLWGSNERRAEALRTGDTAIAVFTGERMGERTVRCMLCVC